MQYVVVARHQRELHARLRRGAGIGAREHAHAVRTLKRGDGDVGIDHPLRRHAVGIAFVVAFGFRGVLGHQHISAGFLAVENVADGNECNDRVVFHIRHIHRAGPHHRALIVFELAFVPRIKRGLIHHAAFDLRQQPVADADDLEPQSVDIDGGDGHAIGIVARQDDAAGKAHQSGLVAQAHGNGFVFGELVARRIGQALLQRDIICGIESKTGHAHARTHHAHNNLRFGIDGKIILVMRAPACIEIAGEGEAGFRLRLGRVGFQMAKCEFRRLRHFGWRRAMGERGHAAAQPLEEAGGGGRARLAAAADEIKTDADKNDDGGDDAADDIISPHGRPLGCAGRRGSEAYARARLPAIRTIAKEGGGSVTKARKAGDFFSGRGWRKALRRSPRAPLCCGARECVSSHIAQ